MDILNTKIKNILQEKTTKVRPENIKKDVTIFNITGTYEGSSTSTNNAKILPRTGGYFNINAFIEEIDDGYDISAVTNIKNLFTGLFSLKKAPTMDTSSIENAQNLFSTCESLVTVPEYNFSSLTGNNNYNMFNYCPLLSNDSLNNILATCITMTGVTNKNLKYMGISSEQCTICQGLSNWSAFTAAGWSTGY